MYFLAYFGIISCIQQVTFSFLFFSSGPRLNEYNVDRSKISVSGISSGGGMATQMHVIFSRTFMGVGIIAGPPFACSAGNAALAVTVCMQTPSAIVPSALELTTESGAQVGNIDATSHMVNDKVYIFNGKSDSVVNPGMGRVTEAFYDHFVPDKTNIKTVFDINSEHCMPTDNYGGQCDHAASSSHYLSNCNYSAAYHLLNHIYSGNLKMPTSNTRQAGQLLKFGQDDFFYVSTPGMYSMDTVGYIYVPSGCVDKSRQCKLHVAFHGCDMGQRQIGEAYVRHGGYNEVGELNDIIILYPQAIVSTLPLNPHGCWDWWGYTGVLFASFGWFQWTKPGKSAGHEPRVLTIFSKRGNTFSWIFSATNSGFQPTALKRMVDRVAGI